MATGSKVKMQTPNSKQWREICILDGEKNLNVGEILFSELDAIINLKLNYFANYSYINIS